jgi:hypothetical protein
MIGARGSDREELRQGKGRAPKRKEAIGVGKGKDLEWWCALTGDSDRAWIASASLLQGRSRQQYPCSLLLSAGGTAPPILP